MSMNLQDTPLVSCTRVAKAYGSGHARVWALRDINLEVLPGEFVALTGPSGCGKSTLMNLVGLLDVPTDGELHLFGHRAGALSDRERSSLRLRNVGFVFQSFNLLMRHSAMENVALPMAYVGLSRSERLKRAGELLESVGLSAHKKKTPLELSGGECQRVAVARALANEPKLILADEPTGNLDSAAGLAVMEILKRLNQDGVGVLLVTHDAGMAKMAHKIVRLQDGRIAS